MDVGVLGGHGECPRMEEETSDKTVLRKSNSQSHSEAVDCRLPVMMSPRHPGSWVLDACLVCHQPPKVSFCSSPGFHHWPKGSSWQRRETGRLRLAFPRSPRQALRPKAQHEGCLPQLSLTLPHPCPNDNLPKNLSTQRVVLLKP